MRLLWDDTRLGVLADWSPSHGFDAVGTASQMPDAPTIWTDGSLVLNQVTIIWVLCSPV